MTPDQALEKLLGGNRRYASGQAVHPNETVARRLAVAEVPEPFACILGCADSRVPPEIIFDQGLGDLFTVRVAGNIVNSGVLGSVEYAVTAFGVPLVMVLGHEGCGAVRATLEAKFLRKNVPGHVTALLRALQPAMAHLPDASEASLDLGIRANVHLVTQKLRSAKPLLAPLVQAGQLAVVGARYALRDGVVELLPL